MLKDIVDVKPLQGHRLHVSFEDGVEGELDLTDLVELRGVFAALSDPAEFRKVRVDPELGTVCWPNGADLDPDVVYAHLTGSEIQLTESTAVA